MPLTAVIGTGAWGTAIAALAARDGEAVALVGRDPHKTAELAATRRHPALPGLVLPLGLTITADPAVLTDADLVLWAVPTQNTRAHARTLAAHLPAGVPLVSLSKGLEEGSLARVSELLAAGFGRRPLAAISGPSMAGECARGQPFCLVAAGPDALTTLLVKRLHSPRLRLYTSTDLVGVELGGALKNVIAIAAGICDGIHLGDNAKAAIVTRGLAEMRRLGRALGAHDATFAGMAGIGDLLTSCYSPLGRNRGLGQAIAEGRDPQSLLAKCGGVAEGAWTCRAAVDLAARVGCELPIASQVANVIWAATPVPTAMENLLSRAPKEEDA
jgi:glycerol-3-phosphate dehydrogenase (NAD(P)+)